MRPAVLTEYQLTTEYPMTRPVTIAHVSDLHERKAPDILKLLKEVSPDVILVTGDTLERYDNRPQYDFERKPIKKLIVSSIHYTNYFLRMFESEEKKAKTVNAYNFLKEAAAIAPIYLSLGNHEQKLMYKDYHFFEEQGVTLLDNSDTELELGGLKILLGGLSTWDYEDFLERYGKKSGYRLLLCHNPQYFVDHMCDSDIDLVLSGHTHGGQFRIGKKGRGFFVPGQGIFGKYAHGSFFDGRLIVSAGCSNTVAFPRLFNPRELVVIRLKGKENGKD